MCDFTKLTRFDNFEDKWYPVPITFTDISRDLGLLLAKVIYGLRRLNIINFTLPAGNVGIIGFLLVIDNYLATYDPNYSLLSSA